MTQYYANSQEAFAAMKPEEVSIHIAATGEKLRTEMEEIKHGAEIPETVKLGQLYWLEKKRRALEIALYYVGLPAAQNREKANGRPDTLEDQ